jgi:hypothetical protein
MTSGIFHLLIQSKQGGKNTTSFNVCVMFLSHIFQLNYLLIVYIFIQLYMYKKSEYLEIFKAK